MGNIRKRLLISGIVQGVFFRKTMAKKAREIGVYGWVKNLEDGSIEVIVECSEEKVDELINWCYKGPLLAKVNNIDIKNEKYTGESREFKIKYSI